jgi:uncharacterized paraquat-inducible protein A
MDNLIMTRSLILGIGWPVLIAGSIYLFIKGKHVYNLVKGSLIGNVVKVLVSTMMVEMYSLGIVSTAFMFCSTNGIYVVLPIFAIWFVMFVWSMKALMKAGEQARALTENK